MGAADCGRDSSFIIQNIELAELACRKRHVEHKSCIKIDVLCLVAKWARRNSHSSQPSTTKSKNCWVENEDTPVKSPSAHSRRLDLKILIVSTSFLLLVVRRLLLVAMPGAPCSVLVPSSDALFKSICGLFSHFHGGTA